MNYTDWYEYDIKPIRVGIYEIEDPNFNEGVRCFALFDGEFFGYAVWSIDDTIDVQTLYDADWIKSAGKKAWTNGVRWRGLKEELKF